MDCRTCGQWRDNVKATELWQGDRVKWRKVEFTVYSTWQDETVDLLDEDNDTLIENVSVDELEAI